MTIRPLAPCCLQLLVLIAGAILGASFPGPARATVLDPRTVHSATLDNGLVVVVAEDAASPVVALELLVRVGSADDPPDLAGLAHLLEHICWTSGGEADPRVPIEAVGGATNAGTLRDYTRYYATVPADDFPLALHALADMALHPRLEPGIVDRERQAILDESAGHHDQPRMQLNDLAFQQLFGDTHPYGRPIEGTESSLSAIQPHHLAAFHRAWYVPNNLALVVAGNVRFDTVLREAKAFFGALLPQPPPPRQYDFAQRPAQPSEKIVTTPGRDAYLIAAFVGPAAADRGEVCASDVLATIISNGCLGRLSGELVENRKLARNLGVDSLTQRDRALFAIWAVCDPRNVAPVKEAIRAELQRLASAPLPPSELALAKRLIYASYCFANETPADRAATLGFYEAVDSYRAATQYPARIAALTAQDIKAVASWYAADPVWVILLPEGSHQ